MPYKQNSHGSLAIALQLNLGAHQCFKDACLLTSWLTGFTKLSSLIELMGATPDPWHAAACLYVFHPRGQLPACGRTLCGRGGNPRLAWYRTRWHLDLDFFFPRCSQDSLFIVATRQCRRDTFVLFNSSSGRSVPLGEQTRPGLFYFHFLLLYLRGFGFSLYLFCFSGTGSSSTLPCFVCHSNLLFSPPSFK